MKINEFFSILLLSLLVISCNSEQKKMPKKDKEEVVDTLQLALIKDLDTAKKQSEIKEFKENLVKIEKKYGEQWGFCECVVANDSVNDAVLKLVDFETPQAEKLLERFDYISQKCQAFISMDNNKTPEERAKHEKRVKNCLRDAKKK